MAGQREAGAAGHSALRLLLLLVIGAQVLGPLVHRQELARTARDLFVDRACHRLDAAQLDGRLAAEARNAVAHVPREGGEVAGLDGFLERREHLGAQLQELPLPAPLADVGVPAIEADLALLLINHEGFREQEHERREDKRGVHDGVEPPHLHRIAEDHPLVAVLARHLVVRVGGPAEGGDLLVGLQVPVRRAVALVQAANVGHEGGDHGGAHERVLVRALLHRIHITVVPVAHVRAVVACVHHEGHKLRHHHGRHVQRLGAQALLVAELVAAAARHLAAPLDVGLQHREVVRPEALVEVLLASGSLLGALLGFDALLEGALDAEERRDTCCRLDDAERGCDE
mmetsp:Transcript_31604/g.80591  ORF Transcript_31604/g.80591 Transcript_31604/m.80591 type:complete len:343 (+) Transcript_31604:35-1063(+)